MIIKLWENTKRNFCHGYWQYINSSVSGCLQAWDSDQQIVIFPMNRNRNRFAEPTSVQIGVGIASEFQNMRIGIGIILVTWEAFANYSRMPKIFSSKYFPKKSFSWNFFCCWKIYCANKGLVRYMHTFYIYSIYSWILWKRFMNRNNICQIKVFANSNNIREMKFWQIWIGIYLWPKYQQIDLGQIYSLTFC